MCKTSLIALAAAFFPLGFAWYVDPKKKIFVLTLIVTASQAIFSGILYGLSLQPPAGLVGRVVSPGIWESFGDAVGYHAQAADFANCLNQGQSLPAISWPVFVLIFSWMYHLTEPTVPWGIFWNGWLHALLVPLVWALFRPLLLERLAVLAMSGLVFLPSSYIYSSQILRDPLIWIFLFSSLGLVSGLLRGGFGCKQWWRTCIKILLGAFCLSLLYETRHYWAVLLAAAVFLAVLFFFRRMQNKMLLFLPAVVVAIAGVLLGNSQSGERFLYWLGPFDQAHEFAGGKENFQVGMPRLTIFTNVADPQSNMTAAAAQRLKVRFFSRSEEPNKIFCEEKKEYRFDDIFSGAVVLLILDMVNLGTLGAFFIGSAGKNKITTLRDPVMVFLGIFSLITLLTIFIFGDGLGNMIRYLCPVFMLAPLMLSLRVETNFPR